MHNGEISDFISVKKHLRHLLDDDIYDWIQGETDSEHLFALFLQLAKGRDLTQLFVVANVLEETLNRMDEVIKEFSKKGPSYYNICMTDGHRMIATHYCTDKKRKNLSFYYLEGYSFSNEQE